MVGLGKRSAFNLDTLRGAFAKAAQQVRSLNVSEFSTSIDLPGSTWPSISWPRPSWKG